MSEALSHDLQAQLQNPRPQSWDDIVKAWQKDEEKPNSKSVFMQSVQQDWLDWRNEIIVPLHLDQLEWTAFTIKEPARTVPRFRGGPFEPWQRLYYGDKQTPTFEEIAANPVTDVQTRDKFVDILSSPEPIILVGIIKDNEVYVVEGMHRCVAIALAASRGQVIANSVQISLAVSDLDVFPTI